MKIKPMEPCIYDPLTGAITPLDAPRVVFRVPGVTEKRYGAYAIEIIPTDDGCGVQVRAVNHQAIGGKHYGGRLEIRPVVSNVAELRLLPYDV